MVGGFPTNHAVRSGTNLPLCSRCLRVWLPTLLESQFGECENKRISFFFCMRLTSLRYQEHYVWPTLKCHTSPPPNPWGARLSPPRPSLVMGWRRMTIQTAYGHLR